MKKQNLSIYAFFLFLAAVFVLMYSGVFFGGKVIIPGDIPYNTPVWQGESPDPGYYDARNYLLSDQINQFYVWHAISRRSIKETGKIPLWNPYIFAGQPLVGNAQSALFYPPNLLLFYFDAGTVATIRFFFNILIMAVFGFLLGRQLGISVNGSFIISAGLILSGPVTVWIGHPHANVFAWFPFIMWSGEKTISSERSMFWSGITGLGAGFSILGGHPETVFHMFLVLAVWFLYRIISGRKRSVKSVKPVLLLTAALICGILISSIQLLPFSDFLLESSTFHGGGRGVKSDLSIWPGEFAGNLTGSATLIYPNFFGNPTDRTYIDPSESMLNYNEQAVYFGLIPLSLFLFVLFRRKNPPWIRFLSGLSFFCLAVAWRFPLLDLFNHLPVFSLVSNGRLKFFFTFTAIIIAGYGLDLIRSKFNSGEWRPAMFFRFIAVPVAATAVFFLFSVIKTVMLSGMISSDTAASDGPGFMKYLIFRIFSIGDIKTMITVFSSILLLLSVFLLIKKKITFKSFEFFLILLCVADLTVPALGYNPQIKNSDILPFPSVFSEFRNETEPFRITSDNEMRIQNYNAVHGVHLMGGYDLPVFKRYGDLFFSQNRGDVHNHTWDPNSELSDFLNIKFYFSKSYELQPGKKYKKIMDNLNFRIYQNTAVYPRAFMVYDHEVIGDDKQCREYLKENDFRLKDTVVLDRDPGPAFKKFRYSSDVTHSVKFLKYSMDTVELEVDSMEDGILVTSEILMPGWKVFLNGVKGDLLRANYTFRAVRVNKGTTRVIFTYDPASFRTGRFLTFAGLCFFVLLLAAGRRKRFPPQ